METRKKDEHVQGNDIGYYGYSGSSKLNECCKQGVVRETGNREKERQDSWKFCIVRVRVNFMDD